MKANPGKFQAIMLGKSGFGNCNRPEILNLVHETPMSGHLGVNKTYHKILNHFFWPGLKSEFLSTANPVIHVK